MSRDAKPTAIVLSEWDTLCPDNCPALTGRFLDTASSNHGIVEHLKENGLLALTELRRGLEIRAFSHVGRIRVGDLNITILPKISGTSLLSLIRYAYGFRRLNLISDTTHLVGQCGFEDLLISQLNTEVQELISRGLLRTYVSTTERLSSPRGRIDLMRIARDGATITGTLPCQYHPRVEDTLLNRILMGGLQLAASMASVVDLRRKSRQLASLMEEQVSSIRLDAMSLDRAARKMNRLTAAYSPAFSIIRLLVESRGIVLEGQSNTEILPGFLFDMNAFFQALMSRFLRDNLSGYLVHDERGLKGMIRYNSEFNPQRRKSPTPRPDFLVTDQGAIRAILDAKYRDLWAKPLPREMLYQLVVYAISHREHLQSTILFPTAEVGAKEARIDVTDPRFGRHLGQICLRPVVLSMVETLVNTDNSRAQEDRAAYARRLVFGESPPSPI